MYLYVNYLISYNEKYDYFSVDTRKYETLNRMHEKHLCKKLEVDWLEKNLEYLYRFLKRLVVKHP